MCKKKVVRGGNSLGIVPVVFFVAVKNNNALQQGGYLELSSVFK
jgi:hypothetical protein